MLTGKTKSDFEKWLDEYSQKHHKNEWLENDLYLDEVYLPNELINALIIEWFDSVGIYLNISPRYIDHVLKYSVGDFYAVLNFKDGSLTLNACNYNSIEDRTYSRHEATEKAIIKANEIYNSQ